MMGAKNLGGRNGDARASTLDPVCGVPFRAGLRLGSGERRSRGDSAGRAVPPAYGETSIAGLYEVTGLTTELETGDQRKIAGTVILSQQGDRYTSTFSLRTMFPTPSGPLPAEVIGKGEGTIEGATLEGAAVTQVVMSTVRGIDPAFAFVPRRVSQRILSSTAVEISPDGRVQIEIQSQPAEGAMYAPTTTTLMGALVAMPGTVPPLR